MDYMAIWNEICFHVNRNRNASERDFQTTVELLLGNLGWSQYRGEIVSQKVIPVGSSNSVKPDIVIKDNGQVILVVELKKPNSMMSERNAEQLKSYMRLLRLSFGILFGETLQVYYEMPDDNELPVKINDIPFVNDSEEGAECIRLLSKYDYSFDNLQKFCIDSLENAKKYKNAHEYVELLCSSQGSEIIVNLLKERLSSDFSKELVSFIIDKISISISSKDEKELKPVLPDINIKSITVGSADDKRMSRSEMKRLCRLNGVNLSMYMNYANQNKNGTYPIDPDFERLSLDWSLLLHDKTNKNLYVFNIPANSISKNEVKPRKDNPEVFLLRIKHDDNSFEDSNSGIKFVKWLDKTISC